MRQDADQYGTWTTIRGNGSNVSSPLAIIGDCPVMETIKPLLEAGVKNNTGRRPRTGYRPKKELVRHAYIGSTQLDTISGKRTLLYSIKSGSRSADAVAQHCGGASYSFIHILPSRRHTYSP